ncbi:MAG: oligosaccharide flippase family protein [Clostridiales bacterium]|nr:oligosaccharide flippase family protein [Clostridiales bacterium]MBP5417613.1 oligosaccharide flippase family protein [Clostridiales bacterium]
MSSNKIEGKALKAGAWYTISNFLMRSIGIITTPIFGNLLTRGEFGAYNNFTTWLGILTICITLNLDSTFISARYDFEDTFDEYILSVLGLSTISSIVSIFVLNLIFPLVQPILHIDRFFLNCILVYLVFLPAVNMFQARERYYYKYKMSVVLSFIVSIGTALLSVLLVVNMDDRLTGRVIGSVIPTIIVGIVLYIVIMNLGGRSFKRKYWKYAIKVCLPFIPHLLSMSLLNSMDKSMITNICGEEANGLYSMAYTCGSLVSILIISLNSAFAPWLGQKLHEKNYADVRAFSKKYILIFVAIAILMMFFAPEILFIIGGGPKYLDSLYVMPPVACGCIFQFMYTMFVNVEQFSKKTVAMAIASASAALLNFVLNMIFIPQYGYIAAAYTTLAGFAWLLAAHMLIVRFYKMNEVYPYKLIALVAVVSISITIVINQLYDFPVLRCILGGIYSVCLLCVIIKYKDQLIQVLKRGKKKNV